MMSKKTLLISAVVFILSLVIVLVPFIFPVFGSIGNSTTFNVTITVNGGSPTITYVDAITDTPNEGAPKVVNFYFNATHPNGVTNMQDGNAVVIINKSGINLTSGASCTSTSSGITKRFTCPITINYFNEPGAWTINATIIDLALNTVSNTTKTYTNNELYAITLRSYNLGFTGTPGQAGAITPTPQIVNNTGNKAFTQINLTAFNLMSVESNFIGVGNFTANTSNSGGAGYTLINNTQVALANSTLNVSGTRDIYLYASIPAGIANGTYDSISPWVVSLSTS